MTAERMLGVITLKSAVYRQIAEDTKATKVAFFIVLFVSLISGFVVGMVNPIPNRSGGVVMEAGPQLGAILAPIMVLVGLVAWWISSWSLALVAKWFGGSTDTKEMLRVTGYVKIFGLFGVINLFSLSAIKVDVLGLVTGAIIGILSTLGFIIGVREAAEFSTWKAVVSGIIGAIIGAVLIGLLAGVITVPVVIYFGVGR